MVGDGKETDKPGMPSLLAANKLFETNKSKTLLNIEVQLLLVPCWRQSEYSGCVVPSVND